MATMKAVRVHEWGGLDAVRIEEAPIPEPKSDEILIRVRASSVNPVDWKVTQGSLKQLYSLPFTLGWDAAGDVVAIGNGITETDLSIGDAVYALPRGGAYAQFAAVAAERVAPKPASLDYLQAAVLPTAALTAWRALFDQGHLEAGQKVLVLGAAGGTGSFAVQLAKWKGAYVIGTASAANRDLVIELGADEYIDYHTTRFEDIVQDADIVCDTAGGENLPRSYLAAKPGGLVITIPRQANHPATEQAAERGVRLENITTQPRRDHFDQLTDLVDRGYVKPIVSAVYPLDEIMQAFAQNQTGHTRGKIAIEVP
jgi:NADPH:quinone reductase-like Zn-dependent oxidoreductase